MGQFTGEGGSGHRRHPPTHSRLCKYYHPAGTSESHAAFALPFPTAPAGGLVPAWHHLSASPPGGACPLL